MNESNSIETIDRTNLTALTKIRLNKITEIENYFHEEISQRKSFSKLLSKYVATFDFMDTTLIVLSARSEGVYICSFTSVAAARVEIQSASFFLIFSLTTGIVKHLLSTTRNKKKNHDKILMLVKFYIYIYIYM